MSYNSSFSVLMDTFAQLLQRPMSSTGAFVASFSITGARQAAELFTRLRITVRLSPSMS